jgi:hypothetical protein
MRDDQPMIEEQLAPSLQDAVAVLRAEHEVSDLWRARVLQGLRRRTESRRRRRRAVIAAAVVLCVVGGSMVIRTSHQAQSNIASASPPVTPVSAPIGAAPVRFVFDAPAAHNVALVGDFDAWAPNGRPMRRSNDGRTWELSVSLPPGRHAFAYLVDGVLHAEPGAARAVEDDFGVPSSVIVVASRGL